MKFSNLKFKKITGTTLCGLAGLNKFKPPGDTILSMLKIIKEPFDEFYVKRGDIAEELAYKSLTKRGLSCIHYNDKKAIGYDNFPGDPYFGGIIDIEIPLKNTLYEIKSRNIKDYEKIQKYGDSEQERQATHYAWMRGYAASNIMWIFFDDVSESEIKAGRPLSTYKNLKMIEKQLPVNYDEEYEIHKKALTYLNNVIKTGEIPDSDISDKYKSLLKEAGF